jgi:hypothetical protein
MVKDTVPRTRELELEAPPESDFAAAYAAPSNDNMMIRVDDGDGIDGDAAELVTPTNWKKLGYTSSTYSLRAKAQTYVVLPGGTYFFRDLDLSAMAQLEIAGPCKIYVTGTLDLTGGGLVNATGLPENCQVFVHPYPYPTSNPPTEATVAVAGGAQVAMAIYAPYCEATITGNGDLFGSIIADTVTVNGHVSLHFDEALADITEGSSVFIERLYWREMDPPQR